MSEVNDLKQKVESLEEELKQTKRLLEAKEKASKLPVYNGIAVAKNPCRSDVIGSEEEIVFIKDGKAILVVDHMGFYTEEGRGFEPPKEYTGEYRTTGSLSNLQDLLGDMGF